MSCSGTPSIFTGNNTVKNGVVTNSKVINLPTPINPSDAATKLYVDTHTSGVVSSNLVSFEFTLIGTTPVQLFSDTVGIFEFFISNNLTGITGSKGPMGKFAACKSNPVKVGNLSRLMSIPGNGAVTVCYLNGDWDVNTGIFINKTTIDFDGIYVCSFIPIPLFL